MSRKAEPGVASQGPLGVLLVDTVPSGQKGSMAAYARLVEEVLQNEAVARPGRFTVKRISLALPERVLAILPGPIRSLVHHGWVLWFGFFRLRFCRADLVHILDGSHAYVAGWIPPQAVAVATAHDIIPFLQLQGRFPIPAPGRFAAAVITRSLAGLGRVDRIMADSTHTGADLVAAGLAAEEIEVVPLAAVPLFKEPPPARGLPWTERQQAGDGFLFHVGTNAFYKNRAGVLRIFARVWEHLPGLRLKLAGPPPSPALQELAARLEIDAAIDFIVQPSDAEIEELYGRALVFLFPSIYEGYGWPPLEAMAAGCPVVCSDSASLPEVVGRAALMAPFEDEAALADRCLEVLQDETRALRLVEQGRERAAELNCIRMGRDILAVYIRAGVDS